VKNGHRVEVITNVKGTTIVCENESPDMYTSIDMAAQALQRKLRQYKERRIAGWHGGGSINDDLQSVLEALAKEEDESEEVVAMMDVDNASAASSSSSTMTFDEYSIDTSTITTSGVRLPPITKVDSFDLSTPISMEEAVFALDYVDHDFYVYKSLETGNITVVYKRHTGGVGLIEP
jgi:putative sigma-54 modulation protein